jgi:hypothetical protein
MGVPHYSEWREAPALLTGTTWTPLSLAKILSLSLMIVYYLIYYFKNSIAS